MVAGQRQLGGRQEASDGMRGGGRMEPASNEDKDSRTVLLCDCSFISSYKNGYQCPGWVAQLIGASTCILELCRFSLWSGHRSGLHVQSLVGVCMGGGN